jgi:betaine-homocysteine S-methyltransferase
MENKKGILERLKDGVVLGAEGYLFELERRGYVKAGPFVPEVVLDFPDAVKELHREFLHAGAEVMVAFTYYAYREKMRTVGREHDLENLNKTAVRLAREVSGEGDALVAGKLSETWQYDHREPEKSEKIVRPMFEEQVRWAHDSGVDFIIAETFDHVGEALIALKAIRDAGLIAMITYTPYFEQSLDGYSWDEACKILADNGADIVGLNCSRGPETVYSLIEDIKKAVGCFVAAQPVPYRTSESRPVFQQLQEEGHSCAFPLMLDPFLHTRFEMAEFAVKARDMGVNYIGICCGGAPHHVRSMAEALGRVVPASKYSRDLEKYPLSDSCKSYWDSK